MKLLVVGSSGQIGTAIMKICQDLSTEAIGIDRRPNKWNASFTNGLTDFLDYEIKDSEGVTDIIFLATEPSAKRLENNPEINLQNYQTFEYAISLARELHARLIMISSHELFGLKPDSVAAFSPQNIYERQKMDFEAKLYKLQKEGLNTGVIRVPVVFGGYDTDLERLPRLVPRWCKQALNKEEIEVLNSNNKIELSLVEDIVKRLMETLTVETGSFVKDIRGTEISLENLSKLIYKVVRGDEQKNGAEFDVLRYGIKTTLEDLGKI